MAEQEPGIVTWGTFAVALYGAVQPWIVAAYKNYRDRRVITIAETLMPEFSFGVPIGPWVGLYGTIFNKSCQTAVKTLSLRVIREATNEQHQFEARFFRKNSFANFNDGSFATPFMIEADSAYPYTVVFHEPSSTRAFEAIYKEYSAAWNAYSLAQSALPQQTLDYTASTAPNAFGAPASSAEKNGGLFPGFSPMSRYFTTQIDESQIFYRKALTDLNRLMFWRAGVWRMTLSVVVLDDTKKYEKSWNVVLTKEEEDNIAKNISSILSAWSGQQAVVPFVATTEYVPVTDHERHQNS